MTFGLSRRSEHDTYRSVPDVGDSAFFLPRPNIEHLVTQTLHHHQFENGLVLLAESMDWLQSAAFTIQLPSGYVYDPIKRLGLGNFCCELAQRGCGARDSRQVVEDLDRLGVDRSASVSAYHTNYGGAMLADNLQPCLAVYADLVRQPHLPEGQLEDARQVCLQELLAAEDDLVHRLMVRLRDLRYGQPFGRASQGEMESIEAISSAEIRQHIQANYQPDGTILSVAGRIDWPRLKDDVEALFGDWPAQPEVTLQRQTLDRKTEFIQHRSNQTQIGIAYKSVPYSHADYFQARGAVGVLSDGMSSRLFTEVREKRGLCYTVYASSNSIKDQGSVLCYAATSTENAQQTLDVLVQELKRLSEGVEEAELKRLKTRIKSSLVMQQESSAARSYAMAGDWFHLGRVMTMDEIVTIIDGLSCESINRYLKQNPPSDFCVVTLGEKELEVDRAIS